MLRIRRACACTFVREYTNVLPHMSADVQVCVCEQNEYLNAACGVYHRSTLIMTRIVVGITRRVNLRVSATDYDDKYDRPRVARPTAELTDAQRQRSLSTARHVLAIR